MREDNEHLQTTRVSTDKGDFVICLHPREAVSTAGVMMKKHKPKLRKPFINQKTGRNCPSVIISQETLTTGMEHRGRGELGI